MLSALFAENAEFLLVGAYAVAAHGVPRATGDIDLWVRPTLENADRVWGALKRFGAPLTGVAKEDFAAPDVVFQMGVAPNRIDLLTSIDGVAFDDAWTDRVEKTVEGLVVPVLSVRRLIENKLAVGRPQDIADARRLQRITP
jgi:hypothetical protein